jgi:hypothetical protein
VSVLRQRRGNAGPSVAAQVMVATASDPRAAAQVTVATGISVAKGPRGEKERQGCQMR